MVQQLSHRNRVAVVAVALTILLVGAALGPVGGALADRTDTVGAADGAAAVEAEQVDGTISLGSGSSSDGSATVTLETDVESVAGYQANVTFDPDVVQVDSVSGVDMDDPVANVDNEAGWASLTQSQANGTDAPTLAEITFDVVESGETELAFVENDSFVNNERTLLAPELDGTTLEVEDSGDGIPGFGTLSALAAVCALLVVANARRD